MNEQTNKQTNANKYTCTHEERTGELTNEWLNDEKIGHMKGDN